MNPTPTILRIALPVPLRKLFDYLPLNATPIPIGARIRVPFGKRRLVGILVEVGPSYWILPVEKLKPIIGILDDRVDFFSSLFCFMRSGPVELSSPHWRSI